MLAFLFLASGCSKDDVLQKFASKEEQAVASGYIEKLRQGQISDIEAQLDVSLRKPGVGDTLTKMSAMVPKGKPDSVTLVGARTQYWNGAKSVNLTYQYQFGEQWFLINCASHGEGAALRILGLTVTPMAQSLDEQNKFTLGGKNWVQYTVLAAAITFALLSIYALVLCARDKSLRRKWAWVLFVMFGVCKFAVNWTTGEWGFTPLAIQLFSSGAAADLYGPWIISTSLPLGAVWYLLRRRRNQIPAPLSNPI
ncbi:MAG TPA: hypothetical protein VIV63_00975 [Steroidobacteraceae bacterium]